MDSLSMQEDGESLHHHLVGLLSEDFEWLISKAKFYLPGLDLAPVEKVPDLNQKVDLLLRHLRSHGSIWRSFIDCVCMEHTMPLYLETMFLSVWGTSSEAPNQNNYLQNSEDTLAKSQLLHSGLKRPSTEKGSSPCRKWSKQQQLESARSYERLLRVCLQQRYGSAQTRAAMPRQGRPFSFSQTYVEPVIRRGKVAWLKENPEKPQGDAPEGDDGANLKVQDLFKSHSGTGTKVTVMLGKPGAGKSMLMHRICQKWADGELDQFSKVFYFEFRQLNLMKQELTFLQLLFELYLSPEDEPGAIFHHLQENAHQVLLVFDGLDEFLFPWPNKGPKVDLDPTQPVTVSTLFSSLCNGSLLPGCWVVTTSRPGKIPAFLLTTATSVFEVWGFDWLQIEKYVSNFFHGLPCQDMALTQLRDNARLQSLCSVPALCCIICICLYHLLLQGNTMNFPTTVTQFYMQMLHTFVSRKQGACGDKGTWLSKNSQAVLGLGELALMGLKTKRVVFYPSDIPEQVLAFAATYNLLSSFRVKTGISQQETCYAFVHLSLQEFFAALYLMVNPTTDETELRRHFFLKSKWSLRTEAKTELLDQFHTFLSGFSSQTCQAFLSQLSQQDEAWVGTKQAAIRQVLQRLAARSLTGPKMIELCHCVVETQDLELVKQASKHLPFSLDFHNFPLTHTDLAALTSLINHAPTSVHLVFSGCSLEPRCLDALADCEKIESLSVRSRKCRDAFAEALSRTLPTMGNLKKLELTGNNISVWGIDHLVQAFTDCLQLEEIK